MSEGNNMESKQAVNESLTTDLTKRLALTFLRAGCAVTGEPLGAKELETMDPVDRQGIEAGIEAMVAELAGMGAEAFPSDGDVAGYIVEEVARYPFSSVRLDIAAKAAGALIKATVSPVLAAKDVELERRDRRIAELEEFLAHTKYMHREAEKMARAAGIEVGDLRRLKTFADAEISQSRRILNETDAELDALRAKLSELAKATPDDLVPSPDEITRTFLIRTYGTVDDRNLNAWREDATRLRDAILAKVAPAFNAQHQEQPVSAFSVGRQMFSILLEDEKKDTTNLRKQIAEYRAREKSMNHALDEAGIERDQTTMQGTLQFWTLPERVGLLIVRDRETRMDLERVTAERDALKTEAGEAWLKSIDATHIEIERDRLAKEVEDLRGELNVAELALVEWAESTKSPAPSVASKLIVHLRTSRDAANASLSEASDEILKLHQHLIDVRREVGLDDGWNSAQWAELPKRIAAKAKVDSAYIKIVELERDDARAESKRLESNLDAAFRSLGLETKARKQAEDERRYAAQRLDDARFFLRKEREEHVETRAKLAEATKAAPAVAAQRWEYKVTEEFIRGLPEDRRADLNAEGARGWELSAVVRHSEYRKDFYLRRPVST